MTSHRVLVVGLLTIVGSTVGARTVSAQTLNIDHQGVACAAAEKFPRLTARFSPVETLAVARVVFQGQNKEEWYSVAMKADGAAFSAVLPKPKKSLKSFRYYIEATGKSLGVSRTEEFSTSVVDSGDPCKGGVMSATVASASVLLQGPAGIVAIPAGFASTGVVTGTAAGSSAGAAGAAATAGAGGGIGATALVIGGVAVAGGAAAVAVATAKGSDDGSNSNQNIRLGVDILASSGSSGSPSTPHIDVSECRPATTFGGGIISLRSDGSFDEIWEATLRVAGRAEASGLQATLTCVSGGGPMGSMSATGSGYSLDGSFSFGSSQRGSQGTISVRRSQ
jgi:hypothetical protein